MKQSFFSQKLTSLFEKLDKNRSYILDGFHPDFFLSLYNTVDFSILLILPDQLFHSSVKYLSTLQEDYHTVFIPPMVKKAVNPAGFQSQISYQIKRSKELLSAGLESIFFIVCAESGMSIPLVGTGNVDILNLSLEPSFEKCLSFFTSNNYRSVDLVFEPGDFCVRGGILDVYPFSSRDPVRLNFLDDIVDVRRFDIQNQLTLEHLENFSIAAQHQQDLLPLKESILSRFLSLFYDPDRTLQINNSYPIGFSKILTCISFDVFIQKQVAGSIKVHIDDNLTSVGIVDRKGIYAVPSWFLNKRPKKLNYSKKPTYMPLNIASIKKGDYLVHREHGVGICMGLFAYKEDNGECQEFLSIKYEDGGIVRVDTGHLDLVDFFASSDNENVALDSLQKRGIWFRKRRAAQLHAEETIEYLLNMYIRRNDVSRNAFIPFDDMEHQFLNDFPYEDTEDQVSAWQEISDDLSSSSPMDRLLCGDVGFGKTEIALRAAFRVVLGNRRVLVLAPTTILANQLYASFHSRLESHAVNVEMVSRFRSAKRIKKVQTKIQSGKNDILIGTHSVLNNDIYLNNIGLLIIDEEHRFGVKQKEMIKCFKEGIDVLSMSATPIPRSLNLALSGIYSISLLQTPPRMRLPIITSVVYFNDQVILETISFEVDRGGQVYFVHNNILSIKHITDRLQRMLPKFRIMYIHGQEPPLEIERKMDLFVSASVHVLVCTSIIEAGIDVPNTNCIIINNAHLFGLSQLYQIRGRVGRGYRQAYAYLMIPRGLDLSNKAYSRIKTIEENTRLGSGYNISRSDMEIRGSGSLFGYKQSGGSSSVGYEMYLRLIQRALHKSGKLDTGFFVLPEDVVIRIFEQRYIPEDYISIESLRLSFYKNLSSSINENEIDKILYNLKDRFGPLPLPVVHLIEECRLRLLAAEAGVLSIQRRGCGMVCKIQSCDSLDFINSAMNYIERLFELDEINFHFLPRSEKVLSICIHSHDKADKYSILSHFLDKLKVVK